MWDVSYLMGRVMHPSLLQDLSGKSGPVPAVLERGGTSTGSCQCSSCFSFPPEEDSKRRECSPYVKTFWNLL